MASQSEALTLIAQIQDKYSAPIRDLTRGLRTLTDHNKTAHLAGGRAATEHEKKFRELRETLKKTSENAKQLLGPAMVGLGIGAIGTGAAIEKLTGSIKDFAGTARDLKFFTAETGLAANALREFEAAGERVGMSSATMDENLKGLAESLDQLRKNRGPLVTSMAHGDPYIVRLQQELKATKDNAEALAKIREAIAKAPETEKHLIPEALGLDPKWTRVTSELLAEVGKNIARLTDKQIADGVRLQEAFEAIKEKAEGLKNTVGADLAPAMTEMSDSVGKFLDEHGEDLKKFLKEVAADIKSADWKGWADGIGSAATEAKKLIDTFGGLNVLEALAALKFGGPAGLAGFLAYKAAAPTAANAGEDEAARQKKYGQGPLSKEDDKAKQLDEEKHKAEKMSLRSGGVPSSHWHDIKGSLADIGNNPAAGIRAEEQNYKSTLKGTTEGTRQGVLAAFREWMNEKQAGGGGIQSAAYHPGGTDDGGLGGGYGGTGGGKGGGLGGNDEAPQTPEQKRAALTHAGQRALLGGHVKEAAAKIRAAISTGGAVAPGAGGKYGTSKAFDLIKAAGGTDEEARTLAAISQAESNGKPGAFNPRGRDKSYGLWQINMLGGMGPARRAKYGLKDNKDLFDPATNARVALALKRAAGGYRDWSTYTSGAYRSHLAGAHPSGQAAEKPKPLDFSKIKPRDHLGLGEGTPATSGIKPSMTTAEINAWNAAHVSNKDVAGALEGRRKELIGALADSMRPHDASLKERLGAAKRMHALAAHIPGRAEGGPVSTHMPYFVGERGPELFVPSQSGKIIPNIKGKHDAPDLMHHLMDDFRLKAHQAAGIVGNLMRESHAFEWLRELGKHGKEKPTGKGGYGWAQWTGKRGKDFLDYSFKHGLDWHSPEANYGYLHHELTTQYGRTLDKLRHARTLHQATFGFERGYEGAGVKAMHERMAYARQALATERQPRDLIGSARHAGMMDHKHSIEGNAGVTVDFKNMPRGVRPTASATGIFKEVKLNRGRAGAFASQEG